MERSSAIRVEALISGGVPAAEARRLAAAGLPSGEIGHLSCHPESGTDLVVARDAGVPLVVREGRVLALDGTDRFVSSSLTAFLQLLERYERYGEEVRGLDDDAGARLAEEARADMRAIDPPALEGECYWAVVCEQMLDGLL